MTDETYKELHYAADVTVTAKAVSDSLLGHDWFGRPYRVISADFDGETSLVVLAYARPEDVVAHNARMQTQKDDVDRLRSFYVGSVPA